GERLRTGEPVGALAEVADVDATVLAVPAFEAGRLLGSVAPGPAEALHDIPYASTGVVFLVFGDGTQAGLPPGNGLVVPRDQTAEQVVAYLERSTLDKETDR